jgi:L-lactate dehydrogenase complex protein LldG
MSSDRDAMLSRVRASLRSAYLPGALPSLAPWTPEAAPFTQAELVARFSTALEAVGGEILLAASAAEAQRLVGEFVASAGNGEVLLWPDGELPLPLDGTVRAAGATPIRPRLSAEREARRTDVRALDRPSLGITGTLAALADTGSLALVSGPQRPMVASLTPLTHLALLPVDRILPDMATFMAAHEATALAATSRNLVFITGPSRTADIEMVITRGVHGPKRLVVVLLDFPSEA